MFRAVKALTKWLVAAVPVGLGIALTAAVVGQPHGGTAYAAQTAGSPPPCAVPAAPPGPVTPTTIETIEQAYRCLSDHYVDGPTLDDRQLLAGAFAGFTQELARRGLDQPDATMPALAGDRDGDWVLFGAVYQLVTGHLPADPALRQALAAATMTGMLDDLHDNHVGWTYPVYPPGYQPGMAYGFGVNTTPFTGLAIDAPREALPPLFITTVLGGPAAQHGLRPGDIISAVNGAPPFLDGVPTAGAMSLLSQQYPRDEPVRLTLHRPATGRTWTVTMHPALFAPDAAATTVVTATLLPGGIALVRLAGFAPNAADQVLQAIAKLADRTRLRGLILDLRGNGGGSPTEVARLLGAFAHGRTWSYDCDAASTCTENHTDDSVPLLNVSLVVLTDRNCASACDAFSGAVKDLRLGILVGTRTAGIVSGAAQAYLLDDNSVLRMPAMHQKGPNGEILNGIGVAPDHDVPLTARDLSTGRDPAVEEALTLLRGVD
jgi:carboxyl-terminal processing protease